MTLTFRYPLRPTRAQAVTLTRWLGVCCDLYNAALQERRDAWRIAKKSITRLDQQGELADLRRSDPDVASVPSQIERSALRRVELAFQAFFRRCKTGETPGYPRFRSRRRYESVSFSPNRHGGITEENRVLVPRLGSVRFHRYRPLGGCVRQATIGRDPAGRWFVSFACDVGAAPVKLPVRSAVGVDLGLTSFATLSDGSDIPNPCFFRTGQATLRRRQQALSRRQRGSASRERARVQVARAQVHVANQRKDFGRKLACSLFRRYDLIAHEDLEISRMGRGHFARSIGDAAWGLFLRALHDKAESAGRHAIAVDPRGTTQRCSGCGATVKKTIAERTHRCVCGVTLGRDHNAALNVLALGRSAVEVEKSSAVEAEGQDHARDREPGKPKRETCGKMSTMKELLPPDPGPPHPHDLRRVLVLGVPPWPALGLIPETTLDPQSHGQRQLCGVFRVRGGRRIVVAVDPAVTPMEYVVEDALTGTVVQSGRVGERMNAAEWNGNSPRAAVR